MKYYAFKSLYGYNCTIREGKILAFTSNETLKYILEINKDLIEIMSVFRLHLRRSVIAMHRIIKFKKKYKIPEDLIKRELGLLTFRI
tara:strand:+ start:321 stop:581 length:261 start_codon:yes stop_codon:yes gene_type:complete